jgi:outer membrane protein insertion porin family
MMISRGFRILTLSCILLSMMWSQSVWAAAPHVLKFSGVPLSQADGIKKNFSYVFEREVHLYEVDEIVRFLMGTGGFSNIEVVEKTSASGNKEFTLVASVLRRVQAVNITGNKAIPKIDIERVVAVAQGQTFERKNLLNAAEELQRLYQANGYHNAKVEIDFTLPNDNEVTVNIAITEGQPVHITDITIDTPNADLAAQLGKTTRRLRGKILGDEELLDFEKKAGEFLKENRYLTARLDSPTTTFNAARTEAKLVYNVENPTRFEFRVDGSQYFGEGIIIGELENEKVAGSTSSPAPEMAEKIRRMYQGVGFANIEVEFKEEQIPKSFLTRLQFKITENPRVRIKKIEIAGNVSRPSNYYSSYLKSSSSDLIGSGFYNRKDIDEGAKKLITELQNQGYLRAKIQSQRAEYSKDRSSVVVTLTIDEGPLTQVRQIRFEGVTAFPKSMLTELIKIKTGAALSLAQLEESIQALKDFYLSQGYLEMKITNENEHGKIVTYNETNTQAMIDFEINEGPQVVVSSVEIKGNTFTKTYVIAREITFNPGDILTPEKISDTVYRLQNLALFGRVSVHTLQEGTTLAERTVIVEVEEHDPGVVTLGVGINDEHDLTYRGYLGLAYRNIYGTGRALSFRVDPKYSSDSRISFLENREAISYLEPYILGGNNRGRVNLVRDQSFIGFSDSIKTKAVIQEENALGFLVERDLTRHIKLTYTAYNFSNIYQFDRYTHQTIETLNIAKFGPLVEFDYRDNAFNPTHGSFSSINLEYSDPIIGSSDDSTQTIQFFKTSGSVTLYQPLNKKHSFIWANSVRGGYLANLSSKLNSGVPGQEDFFLGGRSTIRGFDSRDEERIPNRFHLGHGGDNDTLTNFRMTSDSEFFLVKTEFRFPLFKSESWDVGGTFFYDGGAVLLVQPGVDDSSPYRDSAGFGIRVATPVGPLNLEIGYKLNRRIAVVSSDHQTDNWESPWAFHFSIGSF